MSGRFAGRWRYRRAAGRGIAVSYDREVTAPPPAPEPPPAPKQPPAPEARPEPRSPLVPHSPTVRVLCSCGDVFTFGGDASICPGCGRSAEWPTMSEVERQMRSDLEELFLGHEHGGDGDR
ncbi:MAG TPA: hypothetical protein VG275_05535 [Solirubrobacteraceae bacterium]|jgi:hypothetical protein|nr:hypothetical protein [Solirubrobacteraceae bacterium]